MKNNLEVSCNPFDVWIQSCSEYLIINIISVASWLLYITQNNKISPLVANLI